jgi:hypothetical protein
MIRTIHWAYHKSKMIKGSIRRYIRGSKSNILPSTLPRTSCNTTTIFRLPRRCLYDCLIHLLCNCQNQPFLGALAKLRKAIISFVMSVCSPSARRTSSHTGRISITFNI